jgi:hypothetical protein
VSDKETLSEEDVAELQRQLANVDLLFRPKSDSRYIEFLVARLGHLQVRIWSEKNHFRPHMHVTYKRDYKASYSLDTLERIVGDMPRPYEKTIQDWAASRKPKLNQVWNDLKAGKIPQYQVEMHP